MLYFFHHSAIQLVNCLIQRRVRPRLTFCGIGMRLLRIVWIRRHWEWWNGRKQLTFVCLSASCSLVPHDAVELYKGLQRRQWLGESVNLLSQIYIHRIIRKSIIEVRINHFSVSTWIIDLNIYKLINSWMFIFVLPNWFIKTLRDMLLSRIAVRWLSITEVSSLFLPFDAVAFTVCSAWFHLICPLIPCPTPTSTSQYN